MMIKTALFVFALVALVAGQRRLPLDEKIRKIFNNMDLDNDDMIVKMEVYGYFQDYKLSPSDEYVTCKTFSQVWSGKYEDTLDIAEKICTDYFDYSKDERLTTDDLDELFPQIDNNPTDGLILHDSEFYPYFKKIYNELGIHNRMIG